MNLRCPCCGAPIPLDAAIEDVDAREAVARALRAGPLGRDAIAYLGLFRSRRGTITWGRLARLLGELLDDVDAGSIRRHGRVWAAPPDRWREAIGVVLARREEGKLDLPLRDHAYVREVVVRLADRAEGEAERAREETIRETHRGPDGRSVAVVVGGTIPAPDPEAVARLPRRLRGLKHVRDALPPHLRRPPSDE